MANCLNCNSKMTNPILSAEIPRLPGHKYAICPSCRACHIARVKDGEIIKLGTTPNVDSKETRDMMEEATRLFHEANVGGSAQIRPDTYSKEEPTEETAASKLSLWGRAKALFKGLFR